jgi:hypothetical protein
MTVQEQMVDTLDEALAEDLRISFQDDLGNDKGAAMVNRSMSVEELQGEAPLFGLDSGEYGLYQVKEEGESVRLDPRQTIGEALGETSEATLRFAPEIRGARG